MTEILLIMVTNVFAFMIGSLISYSVVNWGWTLRARTMLDMEYAGKYYKVREVIYDHIEED
jgi:hypothetical protein